jgi:hypothetical protein
VGQRAADDVGRQLGGTMERSAPNERPKVQVLMLQVQVLVLVLVQARPWPCRVQHINQASTTATPR